jgi:hypothetical protein
VREKILPNHTCFGTLRGLKAYETWYTTGRKR